MPFTYPSLLRPTATETLTINAQPLPVPKVELRLRPWRGAPIADTFGGKALLEVAGQPVFAELVVYELFRLSGWEARWVETYGAPARNPKCYTQWRPDALRGEQPLQPIEDAETLAVLRRVAAANGDTYAGCWDVVGWHGSTIVFAELKRYKKDRIQATQLRWLEAGLKVGLQPENFLLVEWDFVS